MQAADLLALLIRQEAAGGIPLISKEVEILATIPMYRLIQYIALQVFPIRIEGAGDTLIISEEVKDLVDNVQMARDIIRKKAASISE